MKIVKLLAPIAYLLPVVSTFAQDQWSQFRGPGGNGHSQSTALPLEWDDRDIV